MNTGFTSSSVLKTFRWAAAGVGVMLIANAVYKEISKFKLCRKGSAHHRRIARAGARAGPATGKSWRQTCLCARSADKLEIARQQLEKTGADVMAIPADITDQYQVKSMINDVVRKYGRIDVLINNAGIIQVGPQETMTIEDYEKAMQTNFWATLYAIHAALPYFRRQGGGRIVNITSIGGKIAVPHLLPYSASKFAAVGLSEGLHAELKKENIQVTTIVPGPDAHRKPAQHYGEGQPRSRVRMV
jgi:short-subunit dehydrogenase